MTVKFGFFDSLNSDRLYNANDINTFFEGVFSDGVFEFVGGALAVEHSPGTMNVLVNTGRAWFNNLWLRNTSTLTLAIGPSSLIHPRKDLVVLEFDSSITVRENSIKVLTGVPAAIPIAPTLANTSTLHQYTLAEIYVDTGVSEITAIDITNKIGTIGTPYATSLLSEPSTAPPTTALNDFQLGDGGGNWIKKTLSETVSILRSLLDGVYSALGHTHTPASIGAPSGSGTSTGTNTGDQTNITGNSDGSTKWWGTGYLNAWYASHTYTYITSIAMHLWRITTNHGSGVSVYHSDRVSTGVPYGAFLGGQTIPGGQTYYAQPYGTLGPAAWIVTLPQQGTMRNLVISTANAQPAGGGGLIVTLTKNGVATGITVTIPPGGAAGRYSDTINSVSWTFGDFLGWKITNSCPSPSAVIVSIGSEMQVT